MSVKLTEPPKAETLPYASLPPATASAAAFSSPCPLCRKPISGRDRLSIYDCTVCKRCWSNFANRRQTAFLIDLLVLSVPFFWIIQITEPLWRGTWLGSHDWATFVVFFGLFSLKDAFRGISPGKWLLDLQVVDQVTMKPTGLRASLKRNLHLCMAAIPCAGLPLLLIEGASVGYGLRWGDNWARTKVVRRSLAHHPPYDMRGRLCIECGYDLTGNLSGICPECGSTVRPRPPSSFPEPGSIL